MKSWMKHALVGAVLTWGCTGIFHWVGDILLPRTGFLATIASLLGLTIASAGILLGVLLLLSSLTLLYRNHRDAKVLSRLTAAWSRAVTQVSDWLDRDGLR